MEQSASWEANIHSASQGIPHFLWNTMEMVSKSTNNTD